MKYICLLIISFLLTSNLYSQYRLTPREDSDSRANFGEIKKPTEYKATKTAIPIMFYTLLFINPMLVIEDKKVYFGLTKEISFGYYPYGRMAFEYSFIARNNNSSHLRTSYNYDFILEAGDFAAFVLTPGAGYFTDTKNKGWFAQTSFGLFLPVFFSAVNPYIKYRHTFVMNKPTGKTDIDDISLGMGFLFYFNN